MIGVYEDHGIRFEYPPAWEVEEDDEGPVTTVSVHAPDGMAFALVRIDESRPSPAEVADEALDAMRDEYPDMDASPVLETIDGHKAIGHDVAFFSFDMTNSCSIRCYQTSRHTVLLFGQWSELDADESQSALRTLRRSVSELDD